MPDSLPHTNTDYSAEYADDELETLVADRTARLSDTINRLERDAAERRSIENRLAVQGRFYQTIIDKIVEGVLVTSRFDIITYINESMQSVAPCTDSQETIGKHVLLDFDAHDVIGVLVKDYLTARDSLETVSFNAVAVHRHDCGSKYYSGSMIPIVEHGRFNGMICTIHDVTLEKEYNDTQHGIQARLIQANKSNFLGFLVAGLDHEVNNPNNSIMLGSELLTMYWQEICGFMDELEEELECDSGRWAAYHELKESVPSVIDGIKQSVSRIENVMTNLREVSGKKSLVPTFGIDLNNAVTVSVAILHHHIRKFTNRFSVVLGDDMPRIPGNAPQIIQVLINLLMNALQSLPDMERAVTVATSLDQENGQVLVTVRDEGSGISPAIMGRIYDPFFTTRLELGGTGLGLPISRHIISEHSGSLHLETVPGQGTCALMILPVGTGKISLSEAP